VLRGGHHVEIDDWDFNANAHSGLRGLLSRVRSFRRGGVLLLLLRGWSAALRAGRSLSTSRLLRKW